MAYEAGGKNEKRISEEEIESFLKVERTWDVAEFLMTKAG